MKTIFNSIFAAFSTFSVIPTPKIDWEKSSLRGILCALPLVGVVIGGLCVLWCFIAEFFKLSELLTFCMLTALPILISGGIHMDGFADTVDALSSHASPEKKREILKDPHAGAFAVIGTVTYILIYAGLVSAVPRIRECIMLLALTHVTARALGAFAGTVIPKTGSEGMLKTFTDSATKATVIISLLWMVLSLSLCAFFSWKTAVLSVLTVICMYFYIRHVSLHEFGGMSGDIAGYCITLSELFLLLALIISERMIIWF